jgi:hypothetical protein
VNVWVALLVQPPVVGAVAYAAGHAFKQYYHAVVVEGRALTAAQVGALATQALREKLRFLSESGYQMHEGSRQLELKVPIEKRRYSERRVILLADKFSMKDYFRLARQPSSLCFVSRDETENVDWPAGHPVSDTLYVGHPLKPAIYYLATEFHNRLFEDKVVEFSKMLRHLGAKNTKIEHIEGYRHGGKIGAELHASGAAGLRAFTKDVSITGSYSSGSNRSVMYQTSYPGTNHSALPKDMVWMSHEPLWKEGAEARQEHRMQKFELDLAYTNDFSVNAKLRASIEESIES